MNWVNYFILIGSMLLSSCSPTQYNISNSKLTPDQKRNIGTDMKGRAITYRDKSMIMNVGKVHGTMAFSLCINPKGEVINVEYNQEESTIHNTSAIDKGIKALYKYRVPLFTTFLADQKIEYFLKRIQ